MADTLTLTSNAAAAAAEPSASSSASITSLTDALRSWRAMQPTPLLLDLRSSASFRARRLRPSVNIHWRRLEQQWFTLPAYGVPFAVLLPQSDDSAPGDETHAAESTAAASSLPPPPPSFTGPDDSDGAEHMASSTAATGAPTSAASSAVLGVKAKARGSHVGLPPPSPSSPSFRFSHAAVLGLLRFYGWVVPEEWLFEDSQELWSAAVEAEVPVDDAAQPVQPALLFSPSPCLQRHFADIHRTLCQEATSRTKAGQQLPDTQLESCSHKIPRHEVSSHASSIAAATAAPPVAAPPLESSFACLDVACGSGRDMGWLLWESQRLSAGESAPSSDGDESAIARPSTTIPTWRVAGLDVSAGALTRAKQLAQQLGFGTHLQVQKARVNQSGQWHVSQATTAQEQPAAVVSAAMIPAAEQAAAATVAESSAPLTTPDTIVSSKPSDQRREKRKRKDALRLAAAAAVSSAAANDGPPSSGLPSVAVTSSPLLAPAQYDLVLMVRFLSRPFIRSIAADGLRALLKPGGFFLLSTFTDDGVTQYAQPSSTSFRLNGVEEIEQLAKELGWQLLCNDITRSEDGRPISDCLFRKPRE